MVVLDGRGRILRPAKLWNDTESAPQATALVERLGADEWAAACGSVPVASFTVTKLAWLREHEPEVFAAVRRVLLPHDWLTLRLTGEVVTDRGDASGTGYWSPVDERWRPDLLALVDGDVDWVPRLPRVAEPGEVVGNWNRARVAPGTGDNMAAALGLGLARATSPSRSVRRARCSRWESTRWPTHRARWRASPTQPVASCRSSAPSTPRVIDAFARLLGVDLAGFDRLAGEAPAGAAGLVLLPYLDGERTPNRPDATGVLAGLRADVTPAQVARAAVEGVVCGLLDGFDALTRAGVNVETGRLTLVGGGARSTVVRTIVASLTGRPVTVPTADELVATGACVQAAAVLHGCPAEQVAAAWGLGRGEVVEPDVRVDAAEVRDRYAERRDAEGDREA